MDSNFRIDVKPDGSGRIFVDGEDVTSIVRSFNLSAGVGEPVELVLQLVPGKAYATGSGKALQLTDGAPAAALVADLDPDGLETAVNKRMEQTGETVGQAIVGALSDTVAELNAELAQDD